MANPALRCSGHDDYWIIGIGISDIPYIDVTDVQMHRGTLSTSYLQECCILLFWIDFWAVFQLPNHIPIDQVEIFFLEFFQERTLTCYQILIEDDTTVRLMQKNTPTPNNSFAIGPEYHVQRRDSGRNGLWMRSSSFTQRWKRSARCCHQHLAHSIIIFIKEFPDTRCMSHKVLWFVHKSTCKSGREMVATAFWSLVAQ